MGMENQHRKIGQGLVSCQIPVMDATKSTHLTSDTLAPSRTDDNDKDKDIIVLIAKRTM